MPAHRSLRELTDAKDWTRLAEILESPDAVVALWRKSPEDVMETWARIEGASPHRAHVVYGSWPVKDGIDAAALAAAGHFLFWTGYVVSAEGLLHKAACLAETVGDHHTALWARYWRLRLHDDLGRLDDPEQPYRRLADDARAAGELTLARFATADAALGLNRADMRTAALDCLGEVEADARACSDWISVERAVALRANLGRHAGLAEEITLPAIEESLALCRAHGWRVGEQWSLGIKGDIIFSRDPEGTAALYQESERLARRLGYARGIQVALFDRAWLARARGQVDEAIAFNREREAVCRRIGAVKGRQYALGELAGLLAEKGDLAEALVFARERELVCRRAFLSESTGYSLGQQGYLLRRQKRFADAEPYHREQEWIGRRRGQWALQQAGLIGQGVAAAARGDAERTAAVRRAVEQGARAAGGEVSAASALNSYAAELIDTQFEADALPILRGAQRVAGVAGAKETLTYCLANLGIIHERLGRTNAALIFFQQQEAAAREWGGKVMMARALNAQGEILAAQRRYPDAIARFREAESIARAGTHTRILCSSLYHLAATEAVQGNIEAARGPATEAAAIALHAHYADAARIVELRDRLSGSGPKTRRGAFAFLGGLFTEPEEES